MKKIVLTLGFAISLALPLYSSSNNNFPHHQLSATENSQAVAEQIPFSFSLGDVTLKTIIQELVAEVETTGMLQTMPSELSSCAQKIRAGEKAVDAQLLEPIMPYVLRYLLPSLITDNSPDNIDLDTLMKRAKRIETEPCSVSKDWNTPVSNKNNVDLGAVIILLCKIKKEIRKIVEECCDEVIETITDCCEDLSEQIKECCEEIEDKIDACCEEIKETVTECCDELSKKIDDIGSCGTAIGKLPFTINKPGNYCLQKTLTIDSGNGITILSDNVILDLNCNTIIGTGADNGIVVDGKDEGIKNIIIKNGSIDGMTEDGIHATETSALQIKDVTSSRCKNGFRLSDCDNARIKASASVEASNHGFLLEAATIRNNKHNSLKDCQALSTSSPDGPAYGFRSTAGLNNSFTRCQAKNTHTDANGPKSAAAGGFSLAAVNFGTEDMPDIANECGSKIIECEACDITAAEVSGSTIGSRPVGIQLEPTFDFNDFKLRDQKDSGKQVNTTAWSPDGCFLATGGREGLLPLTGGRLEIWKLDKATGKLVNTDQLILSSVLTEVNSVAWSPDGCFLAVGGAIDLGIVKLVGLRIYKVNKATGTLTLVPLGLLTQLTREVFSVAWSPDGCFLAVGSNDGLLPGGNTLTVWKIDKAAPLVDPIDFVQGEAHGTQVNTVAWSPDGNYLASGAAGDTGNENLKTWMVDKATGQLTLVTPEPGETVEVVSAQYSPDGCFLATCTADNNNKFYVVDKTTGVLASTATQPGSGNLINSLTWSPDGCFYAYSTQQGGATGVIFINSFNKATGIPGSVLTTQQHGTQVFAVAYSPDGCYLASGAKANDVNPMDDTSGQLHNTASGIIYPKQCIIKKNHISRVFGGCCGIGIQGGCNNLIINNMVYEAQLGFIGVTNIYRNGLCGIPGFFDNIQVPPFCFPCGLCCPVQCPELIQ